MLSITIIINFILAFLKLFIAFSKFFNLKKTYNIIDKLIIPILIFEIITILLYLFLPSAIISIPTMIHFITYSIRIFNISLFTFIYIIINTTLIITTLGLSDDFIPIYNLILFFHFTLSSIFTLLLFLI